MTCDSLFASNHDMNNFMRTGRVDHKPGHFNDISSVPPCHLDRLGEIYYHGLEILNKIRVWHQVAAVMIKAEPADVGGIMKKIFTVIISIFLLPMALFSADTVHLRTNISPPYQLMENGKLSGRSVQVLDCVFQRMKMKYKAKVVPWKRARIEVRRNRSSGLFTVMQESSLDQYATLSAPLILEKWYWYFQKTGISGNGLSDFLKKAKFGAIHGSNEDLWLRQNGYKITSSVSSIDQLLVLLKKKRIDAFLINRETVEKAVKDESFFNQFDSRFRKYTPLGVYYSKRFLKSNPGFLSRFNENLYPCAPEVTTLSIQDRQQLQQIAIKRIHKWLNKPVIFDSIRKQNKKHESIGQSRIIKLDRQWRREAKQKKKPLINRVLNNRLSKYLKQIKAQSNGLYSEIFVMDNKGLNVGQSNVTSDYWQGDEGKFKNTFKKGVGIIFIDNVEYDESSRKFQSQISLSISDPVKDIVIGAVTVGIDVEKALINE